MGRDHPNHDGLVRQCLERQVRSCCRSLCGYHPPGTIPLAHIIPWSCLNIFIRLPSTLSASQVVYPMQDSNCCSHVTASGFGYRVTWITDTVVPPGHQMTFKDALHISSTNLLVKLALPDWAKYLTKHTRKVDLAFTELKVFCSTCSILSSKVVLTCNLHLILWIAIHAGNGGGS